MYGTAPFRKIVSTIVPWTATKHSFHSWMRQMRITGFLGNASQVFTFDEFDAPNGRIIAIDLDHPAPEHWQEIVQHKRTSWTSPDSSTTTLVVVPLHDAQHQ
jgi:hypothetical protein